MASDTITGNEAPIATEDMDLVDATTPALVGEESAANPANGDSNPKREREGEEEVDDDGVTKKQKVDKSIEEERLEKLEEGEGEVRAEKSGPASVGPKTFESSVEMFDYFYKFLHHWSPNVDVNKYEHLVLLELLKKGHTEPEKKIGAGVKAFQIRYHPEYKSRCLFVLRDDDTCEDFSFRKCVDNILPLPENMKGKNDVNKVLGGGGDRSGRRGGGCGRGRGRGRGGYSKR